MGGLGAEPSFLSDGDLNDSTKAILLKGGLHFLGAEEEAALGHRDPARAEAEAKEDESQGLEADELSDESLGAIQLFLEFAEAEVWRTEGSAWKSEVFVVSSLPSCRGLKRMNVWEQRLDQDVLSGRRKLQ